MTNIKTAEKAHFKNFENFKIFQGVNPLKILLWEKLLYE